MTSQIPQPQWLRIYPCQGVYKAVNVNKCTQAGGDFYFWGLVNFSFFLSVLPFLFLSCVRYFFHPRINFDSTMDETSVCRTFRFSAGENIFLPFAVADWFALMNGKMGGELKRIRLVGQYLIEVWKAAGMDMDKVKFVWCSDVCYVPL